MTIRAILPSAAAAAVILAIAPAPSAVAARPATAQRPNDNIDGCYL
jgi:hypothetical protein